MGEQPPPQSFVAQQPETQPSSPTNEPGPVSTTPSTHQLLVPPGMYEPLNVAAAPDVLAPTAGGNPPADTRLEYNKALETAYAGKDFRDAASALRTEAANVLNQDQPGPHDSAIIDVLNSDAKKADDLAEKAEQRAESVYDVQSGLPDNLHPLGLENEQKAKSLRESEKSAGESLEKARDQYHQARTMEDRILDIRRNAVEIADGLEEMNLKSYMDDPQTAVDIDNFLKATEKVLHELLDITRAQADNILRGEQAALSAKKASKEHFESMPGQYYDSARLDMAKDGISLHDTNQAASPPEAANPSSQSA